MDAKKLLVILFSAGVLAGCNTTKPTTAVITVDKPKLSLPDVDAVRLNDVQWHVVGKGTRSGEDGHIDEAFRKARSETLFAITPKGYEDLAINTANMVKTIRQLQSQIKAYKDYYQREEQPTESNQTQGKK